MQTRKLSSSGKKPSFSLPLSFPRRREPSIRSTIKNATPALSVVPASTVIPATTAIPGATVIPASTVIPAKAGIQNILRLLDSRLRGNDRRPPISTFSKYTLCMLLTLFATTAYAEGKIVTKTNVTMGIASESNYFLSPDDEREVRSYFIQPGIEFGYTTAKSNLLFSYVLDANWYDEKGNPPERELSADELDYVGHDMELAADSQLTDRLNIGIGDTYILTRDPGSLDYYSNEITRHKYSKNILTPELFYQFGEKLGIGAGYTNTNIDYKNKEDEDSNENRGFSDLNYNLSSLNTLSLQYQYWATEYASFSPDYTSNQVSLAFNRELKYYSYSLTGGYQHRNFDSIIQDDIDGFVWALAFEGTRPEMLFSLSQNLNDTSTENDYYLATRFNAEIGHLFLEKLQVKLQGYYQYSDYLNSLSNREDNSGAISFKFAYLRNEILSLGFEVGVEARDSSESDNDYENFYGLLGIQLNYDFGSR